MVEVEEPQFVSLAARKAALMQNGAGTGFGKRAPPPPPPEKRPDIPSRTQTTNNPPIATYGSSAIHRPNNQPTGARGQALLPPPPVDRDQVVALSKSPSLSTRNGPPPLPGRKTSQTSPTSLPRNNSTTLVRQTSNDSTVSISSTRSGVSLGKSTTTSSVESGRRLPPAFDEAKLPPLASTRRDVEEEAKASKIPLVSTRSTPNLPSREPQGRIKGLPQVPPRPNEPPKLPSRQPVTDSRVSTLQAPRLPSRLASQDKQKATAAEKSIGRQQPDISSSQLPKRLPPPATKNSILSMGFNAKTTSYQSPSSTIPADNANSYRPSAAGEALKPPPRLVPIDNTVGGGSSIIEMNTSNFNRTIQGKLALVEFYGPQCLNCQQLEPHWQQLGDRFAFASDRLVVGKCNMEENPIYYHKTMDAKGMTRYPTILLFDGDVDSFEKCEAEWNLDALTKYVEQKTGIRPGGLMPSKTSDIPPPIPLNTKPKSQTESFEVRPPVRTPGTSCLICRDFSGPDSVATQYPRQNLPANRDITGYLADVLCGPFPSQTDKARAIFTWLHHNIDYDVAAFFGNRVKHVEARDTITSGKAVCGGYAGVFSAIALKAGLEAVMVTGHGKGFGYKPLQPGERCPPCDPSGHAWNAVRIDDGEWKLIDTCWGAGHISDGQSYVRRFAPECFTMSNVDFGIKHFPQNDAYFLRLDGSIPSWESYWLGPAQAEPVRIFGMANSSGISEASFEPRQKQICVNSGEIVRFQFHRVCEHWDFEKNGDGKPYCLVLKIEGRDGRKPDYVPLESNDFWWWLDINAKDLGASGQTVNIYSVTTVNGNDARGMTKHEYLQKKGRAGMSFGGIAAWDLV